MQTSVPFDEHLLRHGIHRAMALHLFEEGRATLVQAARIADLSAEAFLEFLGEVGVPAVDHSPHDLDEDLANACRGPQVMPSTLSMSRPNAAPKSTGDA